MNLIERITKIADENHDQEMDSWYFGPCDEVYSIAKDFDLKHWGLFIDSTKAKKPDMWRVFLSHAFYEHENYGYVGKSQDFITFQAIKCIDSNDAYLIVQYMDDFSWKAVPTWLRNQMTVKLTKMLSECSKDCKPLLNNVYGEIIKVNS